MEIDLIKARDISEAWARLMGLILDKGKHRGTPRGAFVGMDKIELSLVIIEIEQPWTEPLLPIAPPGIPTETDEKHFEVFLLAIMTAYQMPPGYNYYGYYVEPQLLFALDVLLDPTQWDSNQLCIICGDDRTLTHQADPWIWKIFDIKVEDGIFNVIAYFRSMETWGAFPRFVAAIQTAKGGFAKAIGAEDGKLIIIAKGAHLYEYAWDWAKAMAMRDKTKPSEADYGVQWGQLVNEEEYSKPMIQIVEEQGK